MTRGLTAPAMTIWLTGLAASGKTTLATRLRDDLVGRGFENVELLDGEVLRERLQNFRYSTEDRNAVGIAKARLARDLNGQGKLVIVTGIAHHRATRETIRTYFDRYIEVYLKCPSSACAARDVKGHYARAAAGEYEHFVGVTEPYEESEHVELILDTDTRTADECAADLATYVIAQIEQGCLSQ